MQSSLIAAKREGGTRTVTRNSNTTPAILGLTFHNSRLPRNARVACHKNGMLRTNEKIDLNAKPALDEIERRRAGARRTAWIIGGIAAAFFIAALVQGHFSQIPILH